MIIAMAQMNPTVGAVRHNTDKIKNFYTAAVENGARLAVFPELAVTGYPPRDLLLYDSFIDRAAAAIHEELLPLTAGLDTALLTGSPYRVDGQLYNAALLLEKGRIKSVHLKTLLPDYDVFDERRYFTPAHTRNIETFGRLPVAITICEDIWNDRDFFTKARYAQDPLEELSAGNPRLIINLSASPYHYGKTPLREKMVAYLARKYNAGFVYLNQVGGNDELIFDGSSFCCNEQGEFIYRAARFEEELFFIEDEAFFKPPPDTLSHGEEGINSVYEALCLGIKDYFAKTGFTRSVIGLSGGIDSAVTAALAVKALGNSNVLGVAMPSPYSPGHSVDDALVLAENLGIEQRTIPIDKPLYLFLELLKPDQSGEPDLAGENLQARIRGNILMYLSNRERRLLLTTGNKSELAVGYCTLYGDMSGGLAVLADVPKMMVYELAHHINKLHGRKIIPDRSITKPPSAELRPGQRDEDSLPPYEKLDPILNLYIEESLSPAEIAARGYDSETVNMVIAMVDNSEYKRRQAAPGLRVTARAFGSGWRMPVARGHDI